MLLKWSFFFVADPCLHYINLSEANRNKNYKTPESGPFFCDKQLSEGWYRFVGAAGTKMPTTRVPAFRCGTVWSGWLNGTHPTVEDGEVYGKVCFSGKQNHYCKNLKNIFVKNCGSYFIYKLDKPVICNKRYCGTDWTPSRKKITKQMKQQQHGSVLYLSTCNRFSSKWRKFANKKPILTQLLFCCWIVRLMLLEFLWYNRQICK